MAEQINRDMRDKNPLVLCMMIGAVVVTGKLLPRLKFPLQLEYIHATRYRGETSGGELEQLRIPETSISNRTVLIVDACRSGGAGEIYTAVLIDKLLEKQKHFANPDFTGLTVPDRYVFGYGMDYKNYLRNCDGIYAVK